LGADLTDEAEAQRLFEQARELLGSVDACAAVAGAWPAADEPVWTLPLERWEATLRANLTATFLTARAFLREVERNGHGSLAVVVLASDELSGHVTGELVTVAGGMEGRTVHD